MDYVPAFRGKGSNDLLLKAPPEAEAFGCQQEGFGSQRPKNPAGTMQDARNRVVDAGGDCTDTKLVLSQHEIQFGMYRGQTFHWLLSNNVSYLIMILAAHQQARESGDLDTSALMENKDALSRYAALFPCVTSAVQQRRVSDLSSSEGALDSRRVGFGEHAGLSYREFYESADPSVESYKMWLKRARVQSTGSSMDRLKRYVLGRDRKAASSPSAPPTSSPVASMSSSGPSQVLGDSFIEDETKPTASELELYLSSAPDEPVAFASPDTSPVQRRRPAATAPGVLPADVPLPESWRRTLPRVQHGWVCHALFTIEPSGHPALNTELQTWYYPPGPKRLYYQPPASLDDFFQRPFFLWVPYRMWKCIISCPDCGHRMTACGLYKTVRKVLDTDGWYFMGTEYLECCGCGKKLASWSRRIVAQLGFEYRSIFPAVLTYRLSCDKKVLMQMRGRSLGNNVDRLRSDLVEQHTATWANSCIRFMSIYKKFMLPGVSVPPPPALPEMEPVPTRQCILSAFIADSFTRLEEMRAKVTSVFGSILKMDSTKQIHRKLPGHAAGTAQWVTNVGNEHGQVLMSVLTAAEGYGLQQMTSGLVRRYQQAGVEPPLVLYVEKDCCSITGGSAAAPLFPEWTQLVVRLDIWHFMRRLAVMVTTESHPLYGVFMRRLAASIFVWDQEDMALLKRAMEAEGPGAWSRVSLKEMARHCRRRTRGAQETERLIEETLDHFKSASDGMAILLLDQERVEGIWSTQRRHLPCLQDPPGLQLYTRTGQLTRGGVSLPVYRCSRGFTSLKSFHLHLNRSIPGTSGSPMNFQLYLLEGLTRWNEDHECPSVKRGDIQLPRSYSSKDLDTVNQLAQLLYGRKLVEGYTRIREHTGELIGVNYLFSQTGRVLQELPDNPDVPEEETEEEEEEDFRDQVERVDEGFREFMFDTDFLSDISQPGKSELAELEECVDADGSPGYQHVLNLAECLVALRVAGRVTVGCEAKILALWEKLPEGDKVVHSCGSGTFMRPDASRLVEAVCILLCRLHSQSRSLAGARISRWSMIVRSYYIIRDSVLVNPTLRDKLRLFEINHKTLIQWFNLRKGGYGLQAEGSSTSAPRVAPDPLPPAREIPQRPPLDQHLPGVSDQTGPSKASDLPAAAGPDADNAAPPPCLADGPPPPPLGPKTTLWNRKQLERRRQEAERRGIWLPLKVTVLSRGLRNRTPTHQDETSSPPCLEEFNKSPSGDETWSPPPPPGGVL
ncbi:uncharacterized protein LOC117735246 [Cyclopterus lumpus]|uniref:uncharacterized protein LOC117735246 n=1 Tax=Cyclopterus lumpus TaxID=8103 RepID=UPI001486BA1C|nr:uncharacterized protein LOC117735246 [Cyclopterus lumpus]